MRSLYSLLSSRLLGLLRVVSNLLVFLLCPGLTFLSIPGTLVRELAIKRAKNDKVGQDQIVSDVTTIISTMRASKVSNSGNLSLYIRY